MGREGGSSKTCLWVVEGQLVLMIPCSECFMFRLLCSIFSMIKLNIFVGSIELFTDVTNHF